MKAVDSIFPSPESNPLLIPFNFFFLKVTCLHLDSMFILLLFDLLTLDCHSFPIKEGSKLAR